MPLAPVGGGGGVLEKHFGTCPCLGHIQGEHTPGTALALVAPDETQKRCKTVQIGLSF